MPGPYRWNPERRFEADYEQARIPTMCGVDNTQKIGMEEVHTWIANKDYETEEGLQSLLMYGSLTRAPACTKGMGARYLFALAAKTMCTATPRTLWAIVDKALDAAEHDWFDDVDHLFVPDFVMDGYDHSERDIKDFMKLYYDMQERHKAVHVLVTRNGNPLDLIEAQWGGALRYWYEEYAKQWNAGTFECPNR